MNKFILAGVTFALTGLSIHAFAAPPYNVDDPGTIESHSFKFETAYVSSQSKGKETATAPQVTLRYAPTDNTTVSLASGIATKRMTKKNREWGLADTNLSLKWRFQNETRTTPQFGLSYQVKFPTAELNEGLGTGEFDHKFGLLAAKSFKRLKVFGNVGYTMYGDAKSRDTIFYGVATSYQLTEKVIIGAQVYANTSPGTGRKDELAWGVAMKYNYAPDRSAMLQLGRSERGYSDLNVYAGLGFNFK